MEHEKDLSHMDSTSQPDPQATAASVEAVPSPFKTCPKCGVVLPCEAHRIVDIVDVPAHQRIIYRALPRLACLCSANWRDPDCAGHGLLSPAAREAQYGVSEADTVSDGESK